MRLLKLLALMGALLLFGAVPAAAHVTVVGAGAVAGGDNAVITFRVPTESDTASTTKLRIVLPTATPLQSVAVLDMPGWTATEKTVPLATSGSTAGGTSTGTVSEILWTAQSGYEIKPGSFGQFSFITGKLPDTSSLTFKAVQTYSDNTVVSWIQVPVAGQTVDDLDYPAPILNLGAAGAVDTGGTVASGSATAAATSKVPTILAGVALLLAVAACAVAVRRNRRAADVPAAADLDG